MVNCVGKSTNTVPVIYLHNNVHTYLFMIFLQYFYLLFIIKLQLSLFGDSNLILTFVLIYFIVQRLLLQNSGRFSNNVVLE